MAAPEVIRIIEQLRRSGTANVEAWRAAALDTGSFLVGAKLEDVEALLAGIAESHPPMLAPRFVSYTREVLVAVLSGHVQCRMIPRVPLGVWR